MKVQHNNRQSHHYSDFHNPLITGLNFLSVKDREYQLQMEMRDDQYQSQRQNHYENSSFFPQNQTIKKQPRKDFDNSFPNETFGVFKENQFMEEEEDDSDDDNDQELHELEVMMSSMKQDVGDLKHQQVKRFPKKSIEDTLSRQEQGIQFLQPNYTTSRPISESLYKRDYEELKRAQCYHSQRPTRQTNIVPQQKPIALKQKDLSQRISPSPNQYSNRPTNQKRTTFIKKKESSNQQSNLQSQRRHEQSSGILQQRSVQSLISDVDNHNKTEIIQNSFRLHQNEDANEERLFKFSPLSSKKVDGEDLQRDKTSASINDNAKNKEYMSQRMQSHHQSLLSGQQPLRQSSVERLSNISTNEIRPLQFHVSNILDSAQRMNSPSLMNEQHNTSVTRDRSQNSVIRINSVQRDIAPVNTMQQQVRKIVLVNQETQTQPRGPIQLSPFETYDLLFVKELVNNLNYDNEVLNNDISDLKSAFFFLYEKHKELQHMYFKEKDNYKIVESYRKQLALVMAERDQMDYKNLQLKFKLHTMKDIVNLAVQEQFESMQETDQLLAELELENNQLRNLLNIQAIGNPTLEEINIGLQQQEKEQQEYEQKKKEQKNQIKQKEYDNFKAKLTQELESLYKIQFDKKLNELMTQSLSLNQKPEQRDEEIQSTIEGMGMERSIGQTDSRMRFTDLQDELQQMNEFFQEELNSEEQNFIMELKGEEYIKNKFKRQKNVKVEERDEDLKNLEMMLKEQQERMLYNTANLDDMEEDEEIKDDLQGKVKQEDVMAYFLKQKQIKEQQHKSPQINKLQYNEEYDYYEEGFEQDGDEEEEGEGDDDLRLDSGREDVKKFNQEQQLRQMEYANTNFIENDDEEEEFFRELSQDFKNTKLQKNQSTQNEENYQINSGIQESNLDKTSGVKQREGEILLDLQRDVDQEEQYDYFLESKGNQENEDQHQDYHVFDDAQIDSQEDEELLDEEEIKERNSHMLRELQQIFEREEQLKK